MEDDTRTARERTLAHLDDLMRAAVTTVGAGVLLASSAQAQPPPNVVDPAPPPPPWRSVDPAWRCMDPDELLAKGCVAAYAAWAKIDDRWNIRLDVFAADSKSTSFSGVVRTDLTVSGMTLRELRTKDSGLVLMLAPKENETSVSVQFPPKCSAKKVALKLSLDLKEKPAEGRSIPVKQVK